MENNLSFQFSAEINEITKALAKAQLSMGKLIKNADNPYFKSKYADLAEVLAVCKQPLNENGIAIIQCPCHDNGDVGITTMLSHESGQWIKGFVILPLPKKDPQAAGAAITYARRYALAAMVGLAQEDDDANSVKDDVKPKVESKPKVVGMTANERDQYKFQIEQAIDLGQLKQTWDFIGTKYPDQQKEFAKLVNTRKAQLSEQPIPEPIHEVA